MDFASIVDSVDTFVWGPVMIVLLLGTHIFMTIRTRFIQRKLGTGIKLSVTKDPDAVGDVSQFGALATALAATIGTGNIVGVASAVCAGGPGAVLWMWFTGVFGIATKYSETYISVKYRVYDHKGQMLGGAMYALERGFKHKKLGKVVAVLFALLAAIASFGIGSAVQANSLTGFANSTWNVPNWITAIIVVVLVSVVIFGGITVITKVCEKLVPFMAIFYVASCIVIICMNGSYLGQALALICTEAFAPSAAWGGALGATLMAAIQFGCKRGLFSNESGMGSAPIAAAAATTRNPARQALVSMTGTFWDTVIICAITGITLVISIIGSPLQFDANGVNTLLTGVDMSQFTVPADATWAKGAGSTIAALLANGGTVTTGELYISGAFGGNAAALTVSVFNQIPVVGPSVLCIGLLCFTYSTILGWSYYGNRCVAYLFGKKAIMPYQIIYVAFAFVGGAVASVGSATVMSASQTVWNCSDVANALMVVPNVIAVLGLSAMIAKETKHYVFDDKGGNLMEISNGLDDVEIITVDTK